MTSASLCPHRPSCSTPDQTSSTPTPEFLFAKGAGPLFDIGPYYITTLVHIFGPVATVAAVGSRGRATRTVQVGERLGTEFAVEVPTTFPASLNSRVEG